MNTLVWNFNSFFLDRAALKFRVRRIQMDSSWLLHDTPVYQPQHYSPATAAATAAPAASFLSSIRTLPRFSSSVRESARNPAEAEETFEKLAYRDLLSFQGLQKTMDGSHAPAGSL